MASVRERAIEKARQVPWPLRDHDVEVIVDITIAEVLAELLAVEAEEKYVPGFYDKTVFRDLGGRIVAEFEGKPS